MNRKMLVLAVLFVIGAARVQAQEFKIGYTFLDGIALSMPEIPGIQSQVKTFRDQLGKQVQAKSATFQQEVAQFQEMTQDPTANPQALQDKNDELLKKREDLEKFTAQAEQSVQAKEFELMNPVYKKVQDAIEEVRKEKGYAMIINAQAGISTTILLASDESHDITEAVFAKLGVPMPEKSEPDTANGNN